MKKVLILMILMIPFVSFASEKSIYMDLDIDSDRYVVYRPGYIHIYFKKEAVFLGGQFSDRDAYLQRYYNFSDAVIDSINRHFKKECFRVTQVSFESYKTYKNRKMEKLILKGADVTYARIAGCIYNASDQP